MAATILYTLLWMLLLGNVIYLIARRQKQTALTSILLGLSVPLAFLLGSLLQPIGLPRSLPTQAAAQATVLSSPSILIPATTQTASPLSAVKIATLKRTTDGSTGHIGFVYVSGAKGNPHVLGTSPAPRSGTLYARGWMVAATSHRGALNMVAIVDDRRRIAVRGPIATARPDVAIAVGDPNATNSGFDIQFSLKGIGQGDHHFTLAGIFDADASEFAALAQTIAFKIR